MKGFVQPGDVLDLIAPSGGVLSGQGYLIGTILAVAQTTQAQTEIFSGLVEGVVEMDKLSANNMTAGLLVNWNDTNKEWQIATSDKDGAGQVVEAAGASVLKVKIKLRP